jgi:hypothetical protein
MAGKFGKRNAFLSLYWGPEYFIIRNIVFQTWNNGIDWGVLGSRHSTSGLLYDHLDDELFFIGCLNSAP